MQDGEEKHDGFEGEEAAERGRERGKKGYSCREEKGEKRKNDGFFFLIYKVAFLILF